MGIPRVKSYKYLGYTVSNVSASTTELKKIAKQRIEKKIGEIAYRSKRINHKLKLQV